MRMELHPISYEEKSILQHLMELYQHDMSEFEEEGDVNEHGLFGYRYIDHYWTEEGRYAYFLKADGKLAGFALVRKLEETAGEELHSSIAEFFVMRAYRGRGIGRFAAHKLFTAFPGRWKVAHLEKNHGAAAFWRSVIEASASGEVAYDIHGGMPTFTFRT
ncbi:GNAT family N-acetyltransferase [Paenibacillus doosanensis]|uniref:GNAT family N-acetyltransferase n=1 Tax=Paenibacillus doosanensis TaxID=1229154 RepID=UPI0021808EB6|nr:GNAT family N-acetyltransferase [Paenibacillus doosanensis]MCS7459308.1 GNAT family N-acetyltransferase [Paenibacillus doosanensis]